MTGTCCTLGTVDRVVERWQPGLIRECSACLETRRVSNSIPSSAGQVRGFTCPARCSVHLPGGRSTRAGTAPSVLVYGEESRPPEICHSVGTQVAGRRARTGYAASSPPHEMPWQPVTHHARPECVPR